MLHQFDDAARRVLAVANQEACRLGCEYVGTEFVLLALAEETDGRAAAELRSMGVEPTRLRQEAAKLWTRVSHPRPHASLPMTPRVRRALQQAVAEGDRKADKLAGTVEILHGLLSDPDGVATQLILNVRSRPE